MEKDHQNDICNESFFSSFFNKHVKDLRSFLYYKYGDRLGPEDKVQEAFVKVWQNCHKISAEKQRVFYTPQQIT